VSPLRGEKSQNRPLSKLNTGRFALRAMLPVITSLLPHVLRNLIPAIGQAVLCSSDLRSNLSRGGLERGNDVQQ